MNNWEKEIELPPKGDDVEYAYILKSETTPNICDKETLLDVIENDKNVSYVTTPNNKSFVLPGSEYDTLEPIIRRKKSIIKGNLKTAGFSILFFGGIMLLTSLNSENGFFSDTTGKVYLLVFGIIPVLNGVYELLSLRKVSVSNFQTESLEIKFDHWVNSQESYSIIAVVGTLSLITLMQFSIGLGDSINLAGLVKPKTNDGEYWRLLTCTLLHGNLFHIFFNASAMYVIGKMLIRITSLWHFFTVFLISGLIGSTFSLLFMPNATSVGASGGIMGLIGFILVMSLKLKSIPRNIVKSMLSSIILIAIIGISATEIIDNAAHGGGLIAGVLLGMLLVRKHEEMIPYKLSKLMFGFGILSLLILISGVALILQQFLK